MQDVFWCLKFHVYVYVYVCIYIYIHIYIHTESVALRAPFVVFLKLPGFVVENITTWVSCAPVGVEKTKKMDIVE